MKKIIHNLRKQPEEIRRHILHVLTGIAGVILILLWIYSLGTNLSDADIKKETNSNLKPFNVLKDSFTLPSW